MRPRFLNSVKASTNSFGGLIICVLLLTKHSQLPKYRYGRVGIVSKIDNYQASL